VRRRTTPLLLAARIYRHLATPVIAVERQFLHTATDDRDRHASAEPITV